MWWDSKSIPLSAECLVHTNTSKLQGDFVKFVSLFSADSKKLEAQRDHETHVWTHSYDKAVVFEATDFASNRSF